MPSEGQAGLGDFAETTSRPTAEARAVAGMEQAGTDATSATDAEADGHVDVALQSIDYTLERTDAGEETPVIHIFARHPDGTPEHIRVRGFRPYFYVPDDEVDRLRDDDRITDVEPGFEAIDGASVTRVYAQTPRDVGQIRDRYTHYEADVRFPNRLLIDRGIKAGIRVPERRDDGAIDVTAEEVEPAEVAADPRVFFFDIEVDDRRGFPEDGEEPIISIAAHDSAGDRYLAWLYVAPDGDGEVPEALDGFDPIRSDTEVELRVFEAEDAMLDDVLAYFETNEIDLLSGWNTDDFDAPYLLDRLERLDDGSSHDLDINRLSRVDEVWRSNFGGPDIKGRVVFDLLYAYRRTQFTELDSYRLDAVAEHELGVGKERYPGSIGDLWEDDPERLLEYNVRDVELCVELDRKQQVIAFWDEVRSLVGCQLEDAPTPGDTVDMYILHKVYGDFVLPSRGRQQGEAYEGGAVFDPISGIRENVSVLDLKSLYPMCMRTMNASPESKVDPAEYDGPMYRAPNDIHFRKEPPGIVREIVDELLNEREQKKRHRDQHDLDSERYEMYDRQQGAVKVLMNCFTPDTEVVTPEGIVGITELEVGDEVYSINPETMTVELKPVVETHDYPDYGGPLVDIQSSLVDFRLTPNHRMLVRQNDKNGITDDRWDFKEVGTLKEYCRYELPWEWSFDHGDQLDQVDLTQYTDDFEVWVRPNCHGRTFTTELGFRPPLVLKSELGVEGYVLDPEEFEEHREYIDSVSDITLIHKEPNRKWIPRTYDGDDFIQLLAWYITEGSVYTSESKYFGEQFRGSSTTVNLAQDRTARTDGGEGHQSIGELLDRMGFDYYVDDKYYQFTSKLLGEILESLCGRGSEGKSIPEFIFSLSEQQKRLFFDRLLEGDGGIRHNTWRYSTKSKELRDDVVRLAVELGYTPRVKFDSGVWRVLSTEGQKNTVSPNRHASTSQTDNGVYCVTVADNHTLLAGRNGRFQFIGQSLYGTLGWTRFRLYDKDMGAAVTAAGRSVIEYTKEIAESVDKKVIYGDTDSIMVSVGEDVEINEAIDNSLELEQLINASYDDFASEELNAEEHYFEIEFEKLYRRFFQAGKKKRYAGHIVWSEGKEVDDIDITGFEYQRSDIAPITKEVQHEVLERIVREGDVEGVKEYLHDIITRFEAGEFSLEEIAIPGGIGKRLDNYETDTAHVRGAKYANLLLGTNFDRGAKPKRLYLEKVHPDFFARIEADRGETLGRRSLYDAFKRDPDVICFEYADQVPDEFEVDYPKMLDKTLKGPISRILEALDLTWDEVKAGQTQTGLGQF